MLPSMLRNPRAMANVRNRWWCQSQRNPSAISSLKGRRSTTSSVAAGARFVTTMANTSPADTANVAASKTTGRTKPVNSRRLASGGPRNWLATISAEYIRPFARSRCWASTIAGMNVWALLS